MATSSSINLVANRDNIITEALEILGVLGDGDTPSANDLTTCARSLNYMVKAWQSRGFNLFAIQTVYVFLEKSKHVYSLGPSGDHFATTINRTQVATAQTSGNNTLVVDSITGISNSDNIGIELDDGTMQWTTVNGVPSGSTVTLTANLTDDVAVDQWVYSYTSKANRPRKILSAVVRDESGNDIPVSKMSDQDYLDLTTKDNDGKVVQYYFDPQVGTALLSVWPETDSVTDYLVLRVERTLEDLDAASDDLDFPQEWYLALSYNLAKVVGTKYGASDFTMSMATRLAMESLFDAESGDTEDELQFRPDDRWNRNVGY